MKQFAIVLAAVTCLRLGWAQDASVGPGDAVGRAPGARLERVEIVGKPLSDDDLRRRSKVAKQVYGREEMDQYGDTNVADVLKRLPGVSMQGNAPRLRGLGSGYTQLLLNGDPAPPGFALDQLSPSQVERIEITKGTTADLSAQAVAGTINIILKDAPRVSQRDLRLGLGYNVDRPTLSGNFTFGERWDGMSLSLPLSVFEWRGLGQSQTQNFAPGLDGAPARDSESNDTLYFGHGWNLGPRLGWKISDDESLTWQSFLQRGVWNNQATYQDQSISGDPSLDNNGDTHGTWQNLRSNLTWVNHFSGSERIELKGGVQFSRSSFDYQSERDGVPQIHALGDNAEHGLTQAGNYSRLLNDAHSLTVGWDLEWRQRDERRTVTDQGVVQLPVYDGQAFSAHILRQAVFAQDEWEMNRQWSTYLGVRLENIETQSVGNGIDIDNTSRVLTPMWHLNYKVDADGRDLVRASLTRSYKAPFLSQIVARPAISNLYPDLSRGNSEFAPDALGNAQLRPELATGLDLAYEKYLRGGGLVTVGFFWRDIRNLIRTISSLQTVSWSPVQRWVSQPVNFAQARTSGLELELKGRAGELLPTLFEPALGLNLRTSLNLYQSSVDGLTGPNNRLDGQQPWSGNVGFDYKVASQPLTVGGNLGFTPGYSTEQSPTQSLYQSRTRSLDLFAQWRFSRTVSGKLSASNLMPLDSQSQMFSTDGFGSTTLNHARTNYQAGMEIKF